MTLHRSRSSWILALLLGACGAAVAQTAWPERPITMDAPDAQETFARALESLSFTRQRNFTRMARGGPGLSGQMSKVFAAAGPELA